MHHVKKKKPIDQICVGCYDTKSVENDYKGDREMALQMKNLKLYGK